MTVNYDQLIIRPRDVMLANGCVPGMKAWFDATGLSSRFREFIKQGLPASVILATEDEYGRRVVVAKIEREGLDG